ncbi:glycoside hydrolase family 3 N-terminal domain-containing protein [Geodermatophilus nigrescens]|uniref:beta-N-acetylhexosaminidase n=1 Tax=Geodermatophilus nigrescens TaxID=1070870 RepID=A0A1M5D3I5_9ACTN|nr:glycoside hydrolase family 3 N-terminal domain-containing protein [Geodermatophilus nigrescens]SHF61528.1 beta-N-acetylhexosaminidase [Geodermatophilus nigrescens]
MRPPARIRPAVTCALLALALTACSGSGDPQQEPETEGTATSSSSSPATTSAEASPSPADPVEEQVDAALAGLDRRAQVAQLFVVGVRLEDLSPGDVLVADGVGGVFLAGRSQAPAEEIAAVTGRWVDSAPGPRPWTAADQEGGAVQSLQGPGFERLPAAVDQGQLPPDQLAALADGLGADLASAGITLDLAPVADVVPAGTEADNDPIGAFGRQYGSTPADVVPDVRAVVDGLAAHGVTATVKHFPGLGLVDENTDEVPGVTDEVTTASSEQVAAFGELARSDADPFVMVSSAIYPRLDPAAPATFSRQVITTLLRGFLRFDGVVISDDVGAAAAFQDTPPGDRAVRFLEAGGTLVLTVDPAVYPEMLDAVLARAEADPAFSEVVDAAVRTALTAKAESGLLG